MIRLFSMVLLGCAAHGATYPIPKEGDWVVRDFRFHTGEILPELRLHYTTVGAPTGEPVLILHGTGGSGTGFLNDRFAGELFGRGQPLDAQTHYLILPDSIGAGSSSKPSDGMRAHFPQYDYEDMVRAQYRLITEHLGLRHIRLVVGNSMGGMHAWMWGEMYPEFMDALMPMAALPAAIGGRNWIMRRMVIDAIRNDPEWRNGDYDKQPQAFRTAAVVYSIATTGGAFPLLKLAPSQEKADAYFKQRLSQTSADANDTLYQFEAARDYNPEPGLGKIKAQVFAVNSADDERNPPELGILERDIKVIPHGRSAIVPFSEETTGHNTVSGAKFWKPYLVELLGSAPELVSKP